jgi:hypothetical protein
LVGPSGRKAAIGSGMVAEVSLLGAPRTVLSCLLTPPQNCTRTPLANIEPWLEAEKRR